MKVSFKIFAIISMLLFATVLTGCSEKPGNYTIVRFEDEKVTYENFGKGTDENTVYELGSNGKTVAAYTALAMAEEGVLDLDEKIAPYLDPELITKDERMSDITLRELLCHTAGFSPVMNWEWIKRSIPIRAQSSVIPVSDTFTCKI